MPAIQLKTPVGKAIAGVIFGVLAIVVLLTPEGANSTGGYIVVVMVFGGVSAYLLWSAYSHQKALQEKKDQ